MSSTYRLPSGGAWLDRTAPLSFSFDNKAHAGFAGDTLASALLADGVRVVARSFKYHRRRGIVGLGSEEPSALVRLGSGERSEPNMRATMVELRAGLQAFSQNRWPTLQFDVGALIGLMSPLFAAGFYYKTFMWPRGAWLRYEKIIRRMAGLGPPPELPDPDHYDKRHGFTDILVVGAGPSGLAAALAAGRAGARVLLVDEQPRLAGSLAGGPDTIDNAPAQFWADRAAAELQTMPHVRILPRTTAFGVYDHGFVVLLERIADVSGVRERIWKVRTRRIVLAAGACERPLVFAGNDLPGVMTASAARGYARRFGVMAGRTPVVFTNNDSGYATASELARHGCTVSVVDCRTEPAIASAALAAGIRVLTRSVVSRVLGSSSVHAVEVALLTGGASRRLSCDLLCISGGWSPNVHLFSQDRGRLRWIEDIAAFVPDTDSSSGIVAAGSCRGLFDLHDCLRDGFTTGTAAARDLGYAAPPAVTPNAKGEACGNLQPLWLVPGRGKKFVDLQNDVTAADIGLAAREGYKSVEHLKRYTTLGMGTDQGKLGNINGLALLADVTGRTIPAAGTTTFRPPYTPVTVGAVAAFSTGEAGRPIRHTALQDWHARNGAVFIDAGEWRRPSYYPRAGEDVWVAVKREMSAVRSGVGLVDVATLGKFDVQGRDAAALLERLYINAWRRLAPGRGRYGVMLREDGMVFDDGVVMRLAEDRFHVTCSTTNTEAVLRHIEFLLQTEWPDLRVFVTPVTDHWFAAALNGPLSREVLAPLCDFDVSNDALPMMSIRDGKVAGIHARVMRISFSGELAFEINVPADAGEALWLAILESGYKHDLTVYGVELMGGLRIEKGHPVVGAEIDGRTTPQDLGLDKLIRRSGDFVGRRSLALAAPPAWAGRQLVGLIGAREGPEFPPGGHVVAKDLRNQPQPMLGPVTSWGWSPSLDRMIGLALLRDGRSRIGQSLFIDAPTSGACVPVTVSELMFYDASGEQMRG